MAEFRAIESTEIPLVDEISTIQRDSVLEGTPEILKMLTSSQYY